MKQFLFFAGDHYYPSGGWDDFRDSFDTVEEINEYWLKCLNEKVYDWGHTIDMHTGKMVARYSLRVPNIIVMQD